MHLNKTQIKEQIKIHTHIFKESGMIMKLSHKSKERDVSLEMRYIRQQEGNLTGIVILELTSEKGEDVIWFKPSQNEQIFNRIKKWHTEQNLDFLQFPKEKVQPELHHN